MPSGVYKRTKEHNKKISEATRGNKNTLGKKHSEETRRKMSEAQKKRVADGKNHLWKGGLCNNKNYVSWLKNKRNRTKRGIGGLHTFGDWETLKAQYNFTCPACKRKEPEIRLTEDHIIPISKGGSDNIENIQPLCQSCNSKKHDKIIKFKQG